MRLDFPAAILSGLLLALAFPPLAQADTAFFALVPLLLALRGATPRRGFRLGYAAGLVFWLLDLAWLWRLKDNGGPLPLVAVGHVSETDRAKRSAELRDTDLVQEPHERNVQRQHERIS